MDEVGFSVDGGLDSDWCCDEASGRSLDADEVGAPSIVEGVSFDDVCEHLPGCVEDTESNEHKIH